MNDQRYRRSANHNTCNTKKLRNTEKLATNFTKFFAHRRPWWLVSVMTKKLYEEIRFSRQLGDSSRLRRKACPQSATKTPRHEEVGLLVHFIRNSSLDNGLKGATIH